MTIQRWVLERGGMVRGYLLTEAEPDETAKRALAFGADGEGDLAEAGAWRLVPPDAGLVGDGWRYDGGTYSPPALPAPSLADYQLAVEAHVEAVAAARGYSSAVSCASYVADPHPPWAAEAAAFVAWRSAVWVEVFDTLAAVQGGAPAPTIEALIAGLPVIGWPA